MDKMAEEARSQMPSAAETRVAPIRPGMPVDKPDWDAGLNGSEHPETARLRIEQAYVQSIAGLKRESLDKSYAYLSGLIDKAREELVHARSASNEVRRAALQQHLDELVAYSAGHGISVKLPNRNGEALGQSLANFYVVEEIPAFLGEVKFMIDLWCDQGLIKSHDEMLALTGLADRAG
jgi:hypothetical protein